MIAGRAIGSVVVCDQSGVVAEVITDLLGWLEAAVGRPLSSLVDEGSSRKVLQLVSELRRRPAVFDWEVNVPVGDDTLTLRFAGARIENRILLAATPLGGDLDEMLSDLAQLSSEYARVLRTALSRPPVSTTLAAGLDELAEINSELADMQRHLAHQNAQLERLHHEKNQLLGMVAHDLRNPLNALTLALRVLAATSDRLTPQQQATLDSMVSSANFMTELINDALDYSAIESGKLRLRSSRQDLVALIEAMLEINNMVAANAGVRLRFECPERPLFAEVDPAKFEQVVANLVSNAIEHSPRGGEVVVRLARRDHRVTLEVSDRGPGIPTEESELIFKPYVRAGEGPRSSGAGLGLAIVKRVVEGHGGKIVVDSELGVGSTFRVVLPVDEESSTKALGPAG